MRYLSGDVVAILLRFWCADDLLLITDSLLLLAAEFHSVGTSHIIDHFLLHVAVRRLHIGTLVVIPGSGVNLVGGVAHPVLPCEAPLHLVGLLECLVVDVLH